MREMKYVVTKTKDGPEQIFIFEKDIDHDRFYEVLSYINEYGSTVKAAPVTAH